MTMMNDIVAALLETRSLGARLLGGGPSGLLTSSFAPFGRSGRVTHAKLTNTSFSTSMMHESMMHISNIHSEHDILEFSIIVQNIEVDVLSKTSAWVTRPERPKGMKDEV